MELLTVAEATRLLKVTPVTVRRHIAAGKLPAAKVGRRVRVRKEAVEDLLVPVLRARPGASAADIQEQGAGMKAAEMSVPRLLTAEERRRGLAALRNLKRLQEELLVKNGGQLFTPSSGELLNEARDQRSRDLFG